MIFNAHVNRAGIERDSERATRLEYREVRGTANADLAAFHKVDTCRAGFNAHVAAAVQNGPHLSLQDLGAHWSSDADGLAFNDANGIG